MKQEQDVTQQLNAQQIHEQTPAVITQYLDAWSAQQARETDRACVIGLVGDLGVGKTTFVQTLAAALEITKPVTSPTFVLLRRYAAKHPTFSQLVHIDAYRLTSPEELTQLDWETWLQTPNTLICVEWANQVAAAMPANTVWLSLAITADGTHTITTTDTDLL